MKMNEFMNVMQESLKSLMQEYETEQSAIINDLEEQIKQRDELIKKLRLGMCLGINLKLN